MVGDAERPDSTEMKEAVLPTDVQARWDALADAARQMASATGDDEGFRAAFNAMGQAARGLDHRQLLNTMHVPDDAGEHAEALTGILARIPDGWGRWISCGRGWYPLLVELDEQLRALLPNYVVHQVKEKFGGLRYYWESGDDIHDPDDPEPSIPGPERGDAERAAWEREYSAWYERLEAYLLTPGGQRRTRDLQRRVELAEKLVEAAERRAAVTCELCGATGRLHRTPARSPWYQTLCPTCADQRGYVRAGQ